MSSRVLAVLFSALWLGALAGLAQRPAPRAERVGDGLLLTVLEPDAIPAINNPQFVSAAEADSFMKDNEPVLGIFDGEVAKAYSLWQLDRHEIVNDQTGKLGAFAVTW